ncbi:PREDICTED: complement component C1q receptor-like [Cyprinodon variegatus]|uniref:complement component C1q receptor-like n=1 Tax=Cyprinodon variegatus TaxID=28743 RepID=UPI000742711A|nr:PREDICTED: complement component C1q receptor-like [Cyprinodon variegatus]
MAVMLLTFVLTLIGILGGPSGAQEEMLCTPKACLILHMKNVSFHAAQNRCRHDGGYLVTVRDRNEEMDLHLLLSLRKKQHEEEVLNIWIGLKKNQGDCTQLNEPLRGFKWVSGEPLSQYSNWKKEPADTCSSDRCVKVEYSFSQQDGLSWTSESCWNKGAPYACKFLFKGMCSSLTLLGPGKIIYQAIFSPHHPLNSGLKLLPFGTRARVFCGDREMDSPQCILQNGSYSWTHPGPFCKPGPKSCGQNNGGCEHECRLQGETARCLCREGHELDEDGFSCRIEDPCKPGLCEHRCLPGKTGFSCQCPSGFRLAENQHNCSDIDECVSQACEGHGCVNTRGGYHCVCEQGYELSQGRCVDVDECGAAPCSQQHSCINSVGSFQCVKLLTKGNQETQGNQKTQGNQETQGNQQIQGNQEIKEAITAAPSQYGQPPILTHTATPLSDLVNVTDQNRTQYLVPGASTGNRVLVCILGSVIPLLALIALTLFITIFRCSRSRKELKKKQNTADGYCWVPSGLDPRLEKLYESIVADDL